MKPKHYLLLILFSFFALGCNQSQIDKSSSDQEMKPRHEGHPGEILVVMTPDQSKSIFGEAVEKSFTETPYIITPQLESALTVIEKTPEQYQKFFLLYRNVLLLNIGQTSMHKDPKIKLYRDKDARDQLVFEIFASSRTDAANYLISKKDYIIQIIENKELERLQKDDYTRYNQDVINMLAADYGIELNIPLEFKIMEKRPDFIWLKLPQRQLAQDISDNTIIANQNIALDKSIIIYTYPYEQDSTFTQKFLMAKRDSVMKYNVPGETPNSYMGTEYGYGVEPRYKEITHRDDFAVEMKGIWRLMNGFMGGPFVSLTKVDEANNRIVTVEGYIYAPHDKKREYIRSVEAVVKTLNFLGEK